MMGEIGKGQPIVELSIGTGKDDSYGMLAGAVVIKFMKCSLNVN